jgi:hypothetical protein
MQSKRQFNDDKFQVVSKMYGREGRAWSWAWMTATASSSLGAALVPMGDVFALTMERQNNALQKGY